MMSIFCSAADSISSSSWFTVLNIQTLKVAILTMLLHQINFGLNSIVDFLNHATSASSSAEFSP